MPNIKNLLDGVAVVLTDPKTKHMEQWFNSKHNDLKYAYSQLRLHPDTMNLVISTWSVAPLLVHIDSKQAFTA